MAIGVSVIGAGGICGIYLQNMRDTFHGLQAVAIYDLVRDRALEARRAFGIPAVYDSLQEAVSDPRAQIVLNLTRPEAHFCVTQAALLAGKHVYTEKPLGADWAEATALASLAREKGLLLGGAPDTFLGAGLQTARSLLEEGMIGEPIGALGHMLCRGNEDRHPDPGFYYSRGAGPLLDMGPYYVTALVYLLGRATGVTAAAKTTFARRTVTGPVNHGATFPVTVPTYASGMVHFASGAMATLLMTFDVYAKEESRLEIYGARGTLLLPDPDTFGGPVYVLRPEEGPTPKRAPLRYPHGRNSRGLGLGEMAHALATGQGFQANDRLLLHVMEILCAFAQSGEEGSHTPLTTDYERT